jgi:ribonuclease T2
MLDIMPSKRLVIHEYRAHGTCSGLDPEAYFATARRLFESIKIPARFHNPFESQSVSPSDIRDAFLRANPEFNNDMLTVVCGGSGRQLREVRFCFSKSGKPAVCGDNENQRRLCSTDRVFVPPTRSTARDGFGARSQPVNPNANSPLPGPRTDFGRR